MTSWHDNARFDVFCEKDVYVENDHYIYVENRSNIFHGNYIAREYSISEQSDGVRIYTLSDIRGVDDKYLSGLEKAPWKAARDIIGQELLVMSESWKEGDAAIDDALYALAHYAKPHERFVYCL